MKKQEGDFRENLICSKEGLLQNTNRNALAVDSADAVGTDGIGYEIKGWNGSWHITEHLTDTDRTEENNIKYVEMLKKHFASHLIAIRTDTRKNEYYIMIPFEEYIKVFQQWKHKVNFYRINTDTRTGNLKFRPYFTKKVFHLLTRATGIQEKILVVAD